MFGCKFGGRLLAGSGDRGSLRDSLVWVLRVCPLAIDYWWIRVEFGREF